MAPRRGDGQGLRRARNPLGAAVVAYLSNPTPTATETWAIVLLLATALMADGDIEQQAAREFAWRGFEWWHDARCPACGGRGVVKAVRRICPDCHGTGRRERRPAAPPPSVTPSTGWSKPSSGWTASSARV